MRISEIVQNDPAQSRVTSMKANADREKAKAAQLKAQADMASAQLKAKTAREKQIQAPS
jgi:hypothetical protein